MSNNYFTKSGAPATGAAGDSSTIRTEFAAIEAAFDKLPILAANGSKAVVVNPGGTALIASNATIQPTLAGNIVSHNSVDILSGKTMNGLTVSGNVLSMNAIPCFLARQGIIVGNVTGAGAVANVPFTTEIVDQNNDFAANVFIAPANGTYEFTTRILCSNVTTAMNSLAVTLVTPSVNYVSSENFSLTATGNVSTQLTVPSAPMNAGEVAYVQVSITGGVGNTADIRGGASAQTFFGGRRVA